jgi:hypothetical protein
MGGREGEQGEIAKVARKSSVSARLTVFDDAGAGGVDE